MVTYRTPFHQVPAKSEHTPEWRAHLISHNVVLLRLCFDTCASGVEMGLNEPIRADGELTQPC